MNPISSLSRRVLAILLASASLSGTNASAAALFTDGADARSIALGGAEAAQTGSAISALNVNPAALAFAPGNRFELNLGGTYLSADYRRNGEHASLRELAGYIPAAALVIPVLHNFPVVIGLGILPDFAAEVDWNYRDPPGGLGGTTSYNRQRHRSRIIALRTNFGLGAKLTRWLTLGASAGAIYNNNELQAPYIFQSQPALRGFKTLLDLQADGVGVGFNLGAQIRPTSSITIGLSYRPQTVIHAEGSASGNANAQLLALGGGFAVVDPNFTYDAGVRTNLPQVAASAIEWQALPQLRLIAGLDWINWSNAFDQLVISLSHGSNTAINNVVGSDSLTDIAPLRWRDQFVARGGIEYTVNDHFTLRAGYSYARSAIPSSTLTPLTAAIFEHKLSAGAGYRIGRYHTDLAYLWALPVTQRVGLSTLLDGEYSNSSIRVTQHSLSWSAGVDF